MKQNQDDWTQSERMSANDDDAPRRSLAGSGLVHERYCSAASSFNPMD